MNIIAHLDDTSGIEVDFNITTGSVDELKNFTRSIPEHNFILIRNVKLLKKIF